MTEQTKSEVEIAESTSEGQIEMAAAEASIDAVALLNRSVRASGMSQRELAEKLGVGESRVSQVLRGEGNLHITTLARYLRAAGFSLRLEVVPGNSSVESVSNRPLRSRRKSGPRPSATAPVLGWVSSVVTPSGVGSAYTFHLGEAPSPEMILVDHQRMAPQDFSQQMSEWFHSENFKPLAGSSDKIMWHNVEITEADSGRKHVHN